MSLRFIELFLFVSNSLLNSGHLHFYSTSCSLPVSRFYHSEISKKNKVFCENNLQLTAIVLKNELIIDESAPFPDN